jgi:phage baseplate assembly protein W
MTAITRKYSDLDALFEPNLVTGDLAVKKDTNAIKSSVRNLIMTKNFERPFQSGIGSQAHRLLFEQMDDITQAVLAKAITQTITNYEPRVELTDVKISMSPDDNYVNIYIGFVIKTTSLPVSINIALERTR